MAGRKRDNGEALNAFRLPGVYFAMHDLVADEIKGLTERSLVLTLPKEPTDNDDREPARNRSGNVLHDARLVG